MIVCRALLVERSETTAFEQMPLTRTVWTLTPEAFDSLLYSLDPDREQAGRIYETTRRKLLEFFEARGSHTPDEDADETFDRVTRKIAEGEKIEDLGRYCYREENGLKVEQRKLQAARLNTTLNALRLRASRLRRELGKCTDGCLARTGDK